MSGKLVGWAFAQSGLSPTQKLVLVALADNAQDDGKAWPGKGTIVKKTGLGKSSVYRSLDELEEKELLRSGTDERRIDCYWLAVPQGEDDSQGGTVIPTVGSVIENPQEPSEKPNPKPPTQPTVKSETTRRIEAAWETYVVVMKPRGRGRELQPDDRKILREVLKVADPEEVDRAIRECEASDFHMKRGKHKNRNGGKYNSLGKIFKPRPTKGETWRSRIEWWLDRADERKGNTTPAFDVNAEAKRIREEQGLE